MNTDKTYAEALASEYAPKDASKVIALKKLDRKAKIINSFMDGEITDEQCRHCLAATNLGFQYVFVSEEAIRHVRVLERCYISENEKEYYKGIRSS